MDADIQTIALGQVTVSIINVGDVEISLAESLGTPTAGLPPEVAVAAGQQRRFAQNCVYARLGAIALLVDASIFGGGADPSWLIPNYTPPADLRSALASIGVQPDDVTHLVITHAHHDHFDGLTIVRDGAVAPAFPNARCLLSRADFVLPAVQKALGDAASLESRTLGVVQQAGLLELSEGTQLLGPGVQLISAPGETAGHQIVRIESDGQVLYCIGDLIHDPLEIEHPEYMARWAEPLTTLASREWLTEHALAENALLVATHMHGAGRLRRANARAHWSAA